MGLPPTERSAGRRPFPRLSFTLGLLASFACHRAPEGSQEEPSSPVPQAQEAGPDEGEAKALGLAISFLAREVPQWPKKNRCFSCHNNGDGARALFLARQLSLPVDPQSLEETTGWLLRPDLWKTTGPPGNLSDKRLSALQFAHALLAALDSGIGGPLRDALSQAAQILKENQEADGSWATDSSGLPGSPVTYGRMLATVAARQILARVGEERFTQALHRAEAWIRTQEPKDVLGAAGQLIGVGSIGPDGSDRVISEDLGLLGRGQSREGGWGPYVTSPPEVFDTAVALLGLLPYRGRPGVPPMIRRGRRFLLGLQNADGGWPETTRPQGAESYAQRISTSSWATIALLATRRR